MLEEFAQASELARPLGSAIKFERSPLMHVEKEIKSVEDELYLIRDESSYTFKKSRDGKAKYKRLKKRFACNAERIEALVEVYQRDIEEQKLIETDFQRKIEHDMNQMISLLRQASGNRGGVRGEGNQSTGKDSFENQLKEVKELLETTAQNLHRNDNEQELKRAVVRHDAKMVGELEKSCQDLKRNLQEKEFDLESIKREQKQKNKIGEELNRGLQQEREAKTSIKYPRKIEVGSETQQLRDKENQANKLRQLLSESKEDACRLEVREEKLKQELEHTKSMLAERDNELTEAKASLCHGEELFSEYKQCLVEMQHEVEKAKRASMEKDDALEAAARDYRQCLIEKQQELEETKTALMEKDSALESSSRYVDCELESLKRKLKQRDDRIGELNGMLQQERKAKMGLREPFELAEDGARQQVIDKENQVSKLRQLLSESNENADSLLRQLIKSKNELEDTKDMLAQRDTELTKARASLFEGEELYSDYRQCLVETQQELEETKRVLMEKEDALENASRHADGQIGMIMELVAKVVGDVKGVKQVQSQQQSLLQERTKTIEDKEAFIVQVRKYLQQHGSYLKYKARVRRRSFHEPNLTY